MDKPEILERTRQAIIELNSGSTMFAANTLHRIANVLANDIAAETAAQPEEKAARLQTELDAAEAMIASLSRVVDSTDKHCDWLNAERNRLCAELAELKKNVRPPSDYSDLVTENARLRNALRESREITDKVVAVLDAEREVNLQLQADRRDPSVELLAAQCAAHRQETSDELAGHAYRLESLENRLAALKDI